MMPWKFKNSPNLGQLSKLTSGIRSDLAKQIVDAADPATRRIIKDERNRVAESLSGGAIFAGISALAFVNTRYLVPDQQKLAKAVGYSASALSIALGAWWTLNHMTETTAPTAASSSGTPGIVQNVATQAAKDVVDQAEPRIRSIIQEEKTRAVEAAQAGVPFAAGSIATFLATMFLVKADDTTLKAIGYSGTALLLGLGAWIALDKEKEAMTA